MNWELRRKTEAALKAAGEKWQTLFASAPLVTDSRRVTPGSVFVALRGERIAAAVVSDAVRIEIAVFLLIGHAQFLMYALNADRRAEVEDIVDIAAH